MKGLCPTVDINRQAYDGDYEDEVNNRLPHFHWEVSAEYCTSVARSCCGDGELATIAAPV